MSLHRHKSFIMDGYDQMMPTYDAKRHNHHHSNASASTRASTLKNMNQYYHGGFRTKKIHPVVVQEYSRPPRKNAFYTSSCLQCTESKWSNGGIPDRYWEKDHYEANDIMAYIYSSIIELVTDDNLLEISRYGPKKPSPQWTNKFNLNYMTCHKVDIETFFQGQKHSPILTYFKWAFLSSGITATTLTLVPTVTNIAKIIATGLVLL